MTTQHLYAAVNNLDEVVLQLDHNHALSRDNQPMATEPVGTLPYSHHKVTG